MTTPCLSNIDAVLHEEKRWVMAYKYSRNNAHAQRATAGLQILVQATICALPNYSGFCCKTLPAAILFHQLLAVCSCLRL